MESEARLLYELRAKTAAKIIIKDMMDVLREKYPAYDFSRISWNLITDR